MPILSAKEFEEWMFPAEAKRRLEEVQEAIQPREEKEDWGSFRDWIDTCSDKPVRWVGVQATGFLDTPGMKKAPQGAGAAVPYTDLF